MTDTAVAAPEATPAAPAPEPGSEAAPVAAPALEPAAAPAPAPVTPTPDEPTGPVDRRSARKGVRDIAKESVERVKEALGIAEPTPEVTPSTTEPPATLEAKVDKDGRTHEPAGKPEGGQFAKEGEKEPVTPTEPVITPAPDAPTAVTQPVDQPAEAATETRPTFRVELGADHELAEGMSGTVIEVASEDQANAVKALLNSKYVRRPREAELKALLFEAEKKNARMESQSVARERWEGTPEYTALVTQFHQIGESVKDRGGSEEEAKQAQSMFWKGASFELDKLTDVEYSARVEKIEADRQERAGREWREEAFQGTQSLPPAIRNIPEFQQWFTAAVESFNAELAMGHHADVKDADAMHEKFKTIFGQRLVREPAVKTIFADLKAAKNKTAAEVSVGAEQAERDKAAAAATAVKDFKEGVANGRTEEPPNPLGPLGPGAPGATITGELTPDDVPDTSKMHPHELKKFMRDASRGDARRRLGTPR